MCGSLSHIVPDIVTKSFLCPRNFGIIPVAPPGNGASAKPRNPFHSSPLFQDCSNTQRGKISAGHRHILYITVISFLIFCRLSGLIFCRLEQMVPQRCHVDAKELEHNGALMWNGPCIQAKAGAKTSAFRSSS